MGCFFREKMGDIDKSLDEIIKQRIITSGVGNAAAKRKKPNLGSNSLSTTGPSRGGLVQDARNRLLMKQKAKLKDAREKLNQKVRTMDAREILNRIGVQKSGQRRALSLAFQTTNGVQPSAGPPIHLTRTVNNRASAAVIASKPGNLVNIADGQKQVTYTKGSLTVVRQQANKAVAPKSLFNRTVSSIAKNAMVNAGLLKRSSTTSTSEQSSSKLKRKLDLDDYDDMEYPPASGSSSKKKRIVESSTSNRDGNVASKLSAGLRSRLGMGSDAASPLQGYKILVSNLHAKVSQQDLEELFGDIGPLRKVQFVRSGVAQVIFVRRSDAERAIDTYHNRELDDQPMICKLVLQQSSVEECQPKLSSLNLSGSTLRSDRLTTRSRVTPDISVIHSALFHRNTPTTAGARSSITVTM